MNVFIMQNSIVRPLGRDMQNVLIGFVGEHEARTFFVRTRDDLTGYTISLVIGDVDCGAMTKAPMPDGSTMLSLTLTSDMLGNGGEKVCQLLMVKNTIVRKSSQFRAYVGASNDINSTAPDSATIIIISEKITELVHEAALDAIAEVQEVIDSIPADYSELSAQVDTNTEDIGGLKADLESLESGLSDTAKAALLTCFEHVAWTDEHGRDYYDVLEAALNGGSVDVDTLSAVVNLGTHVVYTTDNLQSLRDYLTVYFRSGGTTTEITEYVLQGDITSVGTHVLTITYNNLSTTVNVTVEENTTGILYDWDFTKSLTDSRQLQTAVLGTGEAVDIPGKSEGTTPPERNATGIVFSDAQQFTRLLGTDVVTSDLLKNKTVEVDVASFDLQYTIDDGYGMRFLMLSSPDTNGYMVFNCGLVYAKGMIYSHTLGWKPMSGSTDGTLTSPKEPIDTDISIINGHTVGVYFNNDGTIKMYIDGVSKGTSDVSAFAQNGCKGLQIGAGGRPKYGGCFYNALITGVRIYDGDVA